MAKRQIRKNSHRTEKYLESYEQFQKIAEHADQQAKLPDIATKILHIPDPKWLNRASRKLLAKSEQTLLHFVLYETLIGTTLNVEDTNISFIQRLMPSAEQIIKCNIKYALAQTFYEVLRPDLKLKIKPNQAVDHNNTVIIWDTKLRKNIPEDYYHHDIIQKEIEYSIPAFTNPLAEHIHDSIDWDAVLDGTDHTKYASRAMTIINSLSDADTIKAFEEKRVQIVQDILTEIINKIPKAINRGNKILAQKGYLKRPDTEFSNPLLVAGPQIDLNIRKYAEILMNDNLRNDATITITDDMLTAKPWLIAYVGLCLLDPARLIDYFQLNLTEKYTIGEFTFAVFSLLNDYEETQTYSFLHDIMLTTLIRMLQTPMILDKILSMKYTEDTSWTIDTTMSKPVPKEYIDENIDDDQPNVDLTARGFSVRDIIIANYNMLIDKNIIISHNMLPLLKALGYDDNIAAALCGYMEAIKLQQQYAKFMDIYTSYDMQFNEEYDDTDENEDDQTPEDQSTSSETASSAKPDTTQQVEAIKQQSHHQMEDLTRKHNKEKKVLQHQLDQADKQKAQLSDENEKLKQRIKYLESERNQLQNTLVDYTLKDKHQTDITPDQDETPETQYPSDIGKDIKMICFGGTANWVTEQRSRFPNIEFAGFEDTINTATIAYADLIFVNTFMFNHALYRPIKHEADRVGKELHILPGKGINKCSNYILDTYQEYMMEHSSEKE